jgi:hypothetical protein
MAPTTLGKFAMLWNPSLTFLNSSLVEGNTMLFMAGEDEPSFICRKGFHAINVQAVVDSELRYVVNKETLFI